MVLLSLGQSYGKLKLCDYVLDGHKYTLESDFQRRFTDLSRSNTKAGALPEVVMPFTSMDDKEYAVVADLYGVDITEFSYTYSCSEPEPCGYCRKCTKRADVGL
jgi:7-cyano-7-deazaguanine synthase in queuosine biosynthesis